MMFSPCRFRGSSVGVLFVTMTTVGLAFIVAPLSSSHYKSSIGTSSAIDSSAGNTVDLEGLQSLGFTSGLCDALIRDSCMTAKRFWIMDNSGSMATPDGQRFVQSTIHSDAKLSPCTRWKELQEAAIYHAQLAGYLQLPTEFQFLNSPGLFSQKSFAVKNPNDALKAQQTIQRAELMGPTPLTACVEKVRKEVEAKLPKLMKEGSRVSLIIATDGLPTDGMGHGGEEANIKLGQALGSLAGLPVSTVIRLCTDDAQVVDFYNSLDGRLELNMDVLDDFVGEAKEVHGKNKWLTYGLPLHRFREGGFRSRLADLLDERKLTKDELRDFCGLMFGEQVMLDGLPDPQTDWDGFQREVDRLQNQEELVYNPLSKRMTPWIQMPKMGGVFY